MTLLVVEGLDLSFSWIGSLLACLLADIFFLESRPHVCVRMYLFMQLDDKRAVFEF